MLRYIVMAARCMDLSYFLNESEKRIDFVRRYALVKHQFPVPKELRAKLLEMLWLQSSKITWASKNIMRDRFIRETNDEQLVRRRLFCDQTLSNARRI